MSNFPLIIFAGVKAVHLLLLPVRSARLGHQELEGSAACMLPVALHMPLCCTRVQKSNSLVPFNLLPLQGLQDKMELVAIDLQDKPAWYKDKVYAQGTVLFLGCSCLASYHPEHLREHLHYCFSAAGAFPGARQRGQGRELGPDQVHRQQLRRPCAAPRGTVPTPPYRLQLAEHLQSRLRRMCWFSCRMLRRGSLLTSCSRLPTRSPKPSTRR